MARVGSSARAWILVGLSAIGNVWLSAQLMGAGNKERALSDHRRSAPSDRKIDISRPRGRGSSAPEENSVPVFRPNLDCFRRVADVDQAIRELEFRIRGIRRPDEEFDRLPPGKISLSDDRMRDLSRMLARTTALDAIPLAALSCRGTICRVSLPKEQLNLLARGQDEWLMLNMKAMLLGKGADDGAPAVYLEMREKAYEHLARTEIDRMIAGFLATPAVSACYGDSPGDSRVVVRVAVRQSEDEGVGFAVEFSAQQTQDNRALCLFSALQEFARQHPPREGVSLGRKGNIDLLHFVPTGSDRLPGAGFTP